MKNYFLSFLFLLLIFLFSCTSQNNNQESVDKDTVLIEPENSDLVSEVKNDNMEEEIADAPDIIWENSIRVYIDDEEGGATNVRSGVGGDVLFQLEPGDGYEVFIIGVNDGWFITDHIDVLNDDGDDSFIEDRGYIHGSVLVASSRNYGGEKIILYSEPFDKSEIVFTLTQESLLRLIDGNDDGSWIKVSYHNDGNPVVGWIQSSWLCGSLRTNCC